MRPITVQVGPLAAASANAISLSQTTAGAANLTITGVANYLDIASAATTIAVNAVA